MRISGRLTFYIKYWGVCRGNANSYLRLMGMKIGEQVDILGNVRNFGSEPWLIEIGNCVTITSGVVLMTHDGASRLFRNQIRGMNRFGNRFGTIRILDNCFIGVNAIILPDVTIGPDSIVGAGSVVTTTVPARTVVAGNPARPICNLDEYIERYVKKMLPLQSTERVDLRKELTTLLWGSER